VGPLQSIQLGSKTIEGVYQVFNAYIHMLIKALPNSIEEANSAGCSSKIVRMAESEDQQIALLANASLLADELLPQAAMKLFLISQADYDDDHRRRPSDRQNRQPELREWKRRLVSLVDRLKNSFCQLHTLDLIFTEEGESNLTADMYINVHTSVEEIEWLPSPIFRVYIKQLFLAAASLLSDISGIHSECLVNSLFLFFFSHFLASLPPAAARDCDHVISILLQVLW